MNRFIAFVLLLLAGVTIAHARILQEVAPRRGQAAASIVWTDDSGRVRNFSDFAGYPVVLLPIYTRCPSACLQTVARLKSALADSMSSPVEFRVLLFSFDPTDTPEVLRQYRNREAIPIAWFLGTADQAGIEALLESVGFQAGKAGKEFTHPNLVVFLDRNLRVRKWIYGTNYSGRELDAAIKAARGESDWLGQHAEYFYAVLLFAASLLCVTLCHLVLARTKQASQQRTFAKVSVPESH